MKPFHILLILFVLFFQTINYTQTTYGLAISNGNWGNPNTWAPNGVPGPGDSVVIIDGNVIISDSQYTISGLTLTNGTIFFEGTDPTLTITGNAIWNDGEFDGGNGASGTGNVNSKLIINSGANLIIDTDATPETHRFYEGITVINQGTIKCIGSSNIGVRGLSTIQNEGLFDMQSDADFGGESFSGGTFLNTSTGTFRKSAGADITSFNSWWNFQNEGGTIDAQSGSIHFICSGTCNGANFLVLENSAVDFKSNTFVFKGILSGSPIGAVIISGSTVNIDSAGATLNFQGTGFQFSNGIITGGGMLTILSGSILRLVPELVDPTPSLSLRGGTTILNFGTIRQESATSFNINGNSIVDNRSLFEILSDADFSGGTGSGGTFFNKGTFRKSGGNDITQMNSWWKFFNENGGVIDASSGKLDFTMSSANFSNESGAVIKGNSSIDLPNSFRNAGLIEPGNNIGVLTYIGNFISTPSGVLDIELGGSTAGTEYDQLNVTGNAILNGLLKVRLANGFVPNNGDSFVILNTSGSVDTDSSFISLDIQDGLFLSVVKNSNNITLVVDSVGVLGVEKLNDGAGVIEYSLSQNYPNPFNPSTNINFSIPKAGFVSLEIYSITGERISTLVSEELTAGSYNYNWDASRLSSGIYFYKLVSGSYTSTKKMLLLK
jgi:hypothetical protein